jgi:CRISPR-associated protein Cmr5
MAELARTLEHERAAFAYEKVKRCKGENVDYRKKYATHVRSLPTMVLQNGLGQALAFLLADAEGNQTPSIQLYSELQDWLCGTPISGWQERVYAEGELIERLIQGSRADYQRAQQSVLALLSWMRKFADAYLPKGDR